MKKTLVALAALAATSAFAQSTVEIYGRAHLGFDQWSASGATAANGDMKARRRVADDSSRVGLRVNEDLGGGNRAYAVLETGVNFDTANDQGQNAAANSGSGYFGTRDAYLALGSSLADIRLGRQNAFWSNGKIEDVTANGIHGGVISSYTAPSSGFIGGPAARVANTVKLIGNKAALGGFAGSEIWYATPVKAESAAANKDIKAVTKGITIKYEQGPFAAQYDYAKNVSSNNGDATAATATAGAVYDSTTTGQKLGLAYFYQPTSKVYFINSRFEQTFTDPARNNTAPALAVVATTDVLGGRKQSSNSFGVQHDFGNTYTGYVQYVKQGKVTAYDGTDVADSGSKAYSLAVRKDLSKRTSLSASYNIVKNEAANNIATSGGGQSSASYIPAGAKLKMVGVGIQHNF